MRGRPVDRRRLAELDARGRAPKGPVLSYLAEVCGWGDAPPEAHRERFLQGMRRHVAGDPRLEPLLERLSARYPLRLLSNGSSRSQRTKLDALGVARFFERIVISGEVGCRKPERAIFDLALEGWPFPRREVLMVGDDPSADVEGARQAGLRAVRVCPGARDDGHVDSVFELERWLEERG